MKAALQATLSGRSLTELLVERGAISELDLARTIAEHHRLDHVDLDVFDVDREAATLVDAATARRLGAVPVAILPDGALVVAMHDPNSSPALRELAQLVDRSIQPAVASRTQIERLIDSLLPFGPGASPQVTPAAALAAPPQVAPAAARPALPEKRLRAVPVADTVASTHPADVMRPTAPAAAAPAPTPMQTRNDNEERVRAAEEHGRIADARAQAAEERVAKAEKLIAAANSRAEGLMAAATAANEALARLVGNCEVLERDAKTREAEMQALRSELESERAERVRLEAQLREPQVDEELLALNVRIAELERERDEARAALAQTPMDARGTVVRTAACRGRGARGARRGAGRPGRPGGRGSRGRGDRARARPGACAGRRARAGAGASGAVQRGDDRHRRRAGRAVRLGAEADAADRGAGQAEEPEERRQGEGPAATDRRAEAWLSCDASQRERECRREISGVLEGPPLSGTQPAC